MELHPHAKTVRRKRLAAFEGRRCDGHQHARDSLRGARPQKSPQLLPRSYCR
jgi:hypothetical protein